MTTTHLPGTGLTSPDDPRNPLWLQNHWGDLRAASAEMVDADRQRSQARLDLARRRSQLEDLTADLRFEIGEETNGGGKPKYSNAESRAGALNRALRENGHARSLSQAIDVAEVALATLEGRFDAFRRERQNQLALLSFSAAWLGYWTNNTTESENTR